MDARIAAVQQKFLKKTVPEVKPGQIVRVHQRIIEGEKERTQVFEGIVIALNSGAGLDGTFTVRKDVEGIGVEKTFPIHSPNVLQVEIKKQMKVRRAKLYFLREARGKAARLKEVK